MFFRMIKGVLLRQKGKMFMIAFTIALGASLATAMLSVMFDVGDKVNQELKTYGANITVVAKEASVVDSLYEVDGASSIPTSYLKEADVGNVKKIFWAFNIVDFAPFIETHVNVGDKDAIMVGSWFNHHLSLDTGEELDAGVISMRSWWTIEDGRWLDEGQEADANKVMLGTTLAQELGVSAGDTVKIACGKKSGEYEVVGIYNAGSDEDSEIFAPLDLVQDLSKTDGLITSIEVSAITTPDNELSRQAAKDPAKLTVAEYETWYVGYFQPHHRFGDGAFAGDWPAQGNWRTRPGDFRAAVGRDDHRCHPRRRGRLRRGIWVCADHRLHGVQFEHQPVADGDSAGRDARDSRHARRFHSRHPHRVAPRSRGGAPWPLIFE